MMQIYFLLGPQRGVRERESEGERERSNICLLVNVSVGDRSALVRQDVVDLHSGESLGGA